MYCQLLPVALNSPWELSGKEQQHKPAMIQSHLWGKTAAEKCSGSDAADQELEDYLQDVDLPSSCRALSPALPGAKRFLRAVWGTGARHARNAGKLSRVRMARMKSSNSGTADQELENVYSMPICSKHDRAKRYISFRHLGLNYSSTALQVLVQQTSISSKAGQLR